MFAPACLLFPVRGTNLWPGCWFVRVLITRKIRRCGCAAPSDCCYGTLTNRHRAPFLPLSSKSAAERFVNGCMSADPSIVWHAHVNLQLTLPTHLLRMITVHSENCHPFLEFLADARHVNYNILVIWVFMSVIYSKNGRAGFHPFFVRATTLLPQWFRKVSS